jgi:hypothetical protein
LIAVGAILRFAVSGLDIDVIGIVLMLAGALGLFMFLVLWGPSARRRALPPQEVVEERRVYQDPPL